MPRDLIAEAAEGTPGVDDSIVATGNGDIDELRKKLQSLNKRQMDVLKRKKESNKDFNDQLGDIQGEISDTVLSLESLEKSI